MKKNLLGILLVLITACPAVADDLLPKADSLRLAYRFSEAAALAADALENGADTLSSQNIRILSDNGGKMMNYVCEPEVIAVRTAGREDFLLYCPFEDGAWKKTPNALDSLGGPLGCAVYAPEGKNRIIFSAQDSTGFRSLWSTSVTGGVFSEPVSIFGSLTESSNEIYPVLSQDGTSLYFASDGLYGAGGYDLYVSRLDEWTGTWSTPENLGFPYSSPADDFLYMDSDDGRFSAVVSNRNTPGDSVEVFILKKEVTPVRRKISNPEEMQAIARLMPKPEPQVPEERKEDTMPENDGTRLYVSKMEQVKALRDSINAVMKSLELAQSDFALAPDEITQASILESIREIEGGLPALRSSLDKAAKELQDIELDFLFKGVPLDPDKLMYKADKEETERKMQYDFPTKKFGELKFVRIFAVPFEDTRK